MTEPPCWTGACTRPACPVERAPCRGCPAFPAASPLTPNGGHTCTPDHSLLLSSPTRSDKLGNPNTAEPLKPGNSDSTSGSPRRTPVQNGDGGNCSLQKLPLRPRTHSCRS